MIARIWARLFPSTLWLAPEDLHIILNYHERQQRVRTPDVESVAGPAISMMLYRPAPGHYVGLGRKVIAERRVRKATQYTNQLRRAEDMMAAVLQEMTADGYVNTIHDCWEKEENS